MFKRHERAHVHGDWEDVSFEESYRCVYNSIVHKHHDVWFWTLKKFVLDLHNNPALRVNENRYSILSKAAILTNDVCMFPVNVYCHGIVARTYGYKSVFVLFDDARKSIVKEIASSAWIKIRWALVMLRFYRLDVRYRPGHTGYLESKERFESCAKRQRRE
tara:strand:- start:485 stop:967 length:483 start_codon:yes stop_codon:yes gene_type:complete